MSFTTSVTHQSLTYFDTLDHHRRPILADLFQPEVGILQSIACYFLSLNFQDDVVDVELPAVIGELVISDGLYPHKLSVIGAAGQRDAQPVLLARRHHRLADALGPMFLLPAWFGGYS